MPQGKRFRQLDVRPMLKAGIEPYPEIRKRLEALKPNQGLAILAPFLPAPLIEKLGSEGFKSSAERAGSGTWITYFWRGEG